MTKNNSIELVNVAYNDIQIVEGFNPRKDFSELAELAESIRQSGILQPLTAYRGEDDKVCLIDGERRYRAVSELIVSKKMTKKNALFPVVIIEKPDNEKALVRAILSNEGKRLTPFELYGAYSRLLETMKQKDLVSMLGKSKVHIIEILKIGKASPKVQESLKQGKIGLKQVVSLVKACKDNHDMQDEFLEALEQEKEDRKKGQIEGRKATIEANKAEGEKLTSEPEQEPAKTPEKEKPAKEPAKTPEKEKPVSKMAPTYSFKATVQDVLETLKEALVGYTQCAEDDSDCKSFYEGQIDALCMVLDLDKVKLMETKKVA